MWSNVTIAKLRKDLGLTQRQFAQVLGVQTQSISYWENAHQVPHALPTDIMAALRKAFDRGCPGPWHPLDDEARGEFLMRILIYAYASTPLLQVLLLHMKSRGASTPTKVKSKT